MKHIKTLFALLIATSLSFASLSVNAASSSNSVTAISGYDLVSYHNANKAARGNGHNVSVHDGATYLFANADNKKAFDANPEKYLPAYGGYCAFGVSVGKKFVSDPEAWKIVDGRLYLNLDKNIQADWLKDIPGRIKSANENWTKIANKSPAEL